MPRTATKLHETSGRQPDPVGSRQAEADAQSPISAVGRAMEVLERLALAPDGSAVSDLSRELQIDKSVISRILASLAREGYVHKDPHSEFYQLTFKISALAHAHLGMVGFPERCVPILKELAQETGELIELAVVEDEQAWFVAKVEGWQRVRVAPFGGGPVVLHAMASGKAWLASLPPADALRIATAAGLRSYKPATITSPEALAIDLEQTRQRGYALNQEELMDGASSVGVAIPSPVEPNVAVGSLVVVAPTFRLTQAVIDRLVPGLHLRARALSYAWPLTSGPQPRDREAGSAA